MANQSNIENAIEFIKGSKTATVTFSQGKFISKMLKLAVEHPEVEIIEFPQTNGGYLYARVPVEWVKVSPPRNYNMSSEKREEFAERMRKGKESKNNSDA